LANETERSWRGSYSVKDCKMVGCSWQFICK